MQRSVSVLALLLACVGGAGSGQAAGVPDPGVLGPREVGAVSFAITDPTRAREIRLIVWYPTDDAITPQTPTAIYDQWPLPFQATGAEWAPHVGRTVHGEVAIAAGRFPLLLYSHGGGGAAFFDMYRNTMIASHGFIVVAMTHREGNLGVPPFFPGAVNRANRLADTRFVLDVLLQSDLGASIHPDWIFGSGYSLGGYTMIAVADPRLDAIVTYDGTREALTIPQIESIAVPFLPFGQHCRLLQMELQHFASSPYVGMEGFTPDPSPINHGLFSQNCMTRAVNTGKPLPPGFPPPPPQVLLNCANPVYRALERHFADVTSKYTVAFLKAQMRLAGYRSYLAPGQVDEAGVHFIQAAPGPPGDDVGERFNAFCSQPGEDPGDMPIDHLFITLP